MDATTTGCTMGKLSVFGIALVALTLVTALLFNAIYPNNQLEAGGYLLVVFFWLVVLICTRIVLGIGKARARNAEETGDDQE